MPAPCHAHCTLEKQAYTSFLPYNSPGHSNYHSQCHSQIMFPAENKAIPRTLTRYRNMYFYYLGHCHFSAILQEIVKSQKYFKGRLHETLGFHKTGTYLQETLGLVDSFQEVLEFFFTLVIINCTPGAF